jgi:hypothetical protein
MRTATLKRARLTSASSLRHQHQSHRQHPDETLFRLGLRLRCVIATAASSPAKMTHDRRGDLGLGSYKMRLRLAVVFFVGGTGG